MYRRNLKLLIVLSLALLSAGCSCRTRKVGDGNIPTASEGDILKDVLFAFDSYEISASGKSVLGANAEWLKANPATKVQIEGHCDERGTNEYNMALGAKRAQATLNYLRSLGIAGDRMSTVSYGEELPLASGHNEEAWAKNRRAHFKF